ncbi:MAG: ribosome small subunit-dependent GTPase A [Bacillota bacterium]
MEGIITKTVGGFFFVADREQNIYKTKIRGKIQKKVYPGDYVEFNITETDTGIIEKVFQRENLLKRPKVANIDQVLIMQSFQKPPLNRKLLDMFLLMVQASNLKPLIVINKSDLVSKIDKNLIQDYRNIGFKIFIISVKRNENLNLLYKELESKITALTGPSGVGKSSLINKLVPSVNLEVNPVSESLNRGVHTTREVKLLPVKDEDKKGWIVDTPGFTSLELKDITPEELPFLYPEFEDYLNNCKFNMCSHTHEPKCAVKKAVKKNEISQKRYNTYREILNKLINKEETYD